MCYCLIIETESSHQCLHLEDGVANLLSLNRQLVLPRAKCAVKPFLSGSG